MNAKFGAELARRGLDYRQEPFDLRAGEQSHWYLDVRRALGEGALLQKASRQIMELFRLNGLKADAIAGMGVAGRALATATSIEADTLCVEANDDESEDQRYGYGLHGAAVAGQKVLLVDDVATSGNSLMTLAHMVREQDGLIEDAIVLVDRSHGLAARVMAEQGVYFHALYMLVEDEGLIVPI